MPDIPPPGYESVIGKKWSYIKANINKMVVPIPYWTICTGTSGLSNNPNNIKQVNNNEQYGNQPIGHWAGWQGWNNIGTFTFPLKTWQQSPPWFGPTPLVYYCDGSGNATTPVIPNVWTDNSQTGAPYTIGREIVPTQTLWMPPFAAVGKGPGLPYPQYADGSGQHNTSGDYTWRPTVGYAGFFGTYTSHHCYQFSLNLTVQQENAWVRLTDGSICQIGTIAIGGYNGPRRQEAGTLIEYDFNPDQSADGYIGFDNRSSNYGNPFTRVHPLTDPGGSGHVCYGGIPWSTIPNLVSPFSGFQSITFAGMLNYPFGSYTNPDYLSMFNDGNASLMTQQSRLVNLAYPCDAFNAEAYSYYGGSGGQPTEDATAFVSTAQWLFDTASTADGQAAILAWRSQYRHVRIFVTDQRQSGWIDLEAALGNIVIAGDATCIGTFGLNPLCLGANPYDFDAGIRAIKCATEDYTVTFPGTLFPPKTGVGFPSFLDWGPLLSQYVLTVSGSGSSIYGLAITSTDQTSAGGTYETYTWYIGRIPKLIGPTTATVGSALLWDDLTFLRNCGNGATAGVTLIWFDPINAGSRLPDTYWPAGFALPFSANGQYQLPEHVPFGTRQTQWLGFMNVWAGNEPGNPEPTGTLIATSSETSTSLADSVTLLSKVQGLSSDAWSLPVPLHLIPKVDSSVGPPGEPRAVRATWAVETLDITNPAFNQHSPTTWAEISNAPLAPFEVLPFRGLENWPASIPANSNQLFPYVGCTVYIWVRSIDVNIDTNANITANPNPRGTGDPYYAPLWPDELSRYDPSFQASSIQQPALANPTSPQTISPPVYGQHVASWMRAMMSLQTKRPSNITILPFEFAWDGTWENQGDPPKVVALYYGGWHAVDWNMLRSINKWDYMGASRAATEVSLGLTEPMQRANKNFNAYSNYASGHYADPARMTLSNSPNLDVPATIAYDRRLFNGEFYGQSIYGDQKAYRGVQPGTWNY